MKDNDNSFGTWQWVWRQNDRRERALVMKQRWDKQCEMAQQVIDKTGINIVTCGQCGHVMLHSMDGCDNIECPHCGFTSEACDFPDFFHERSVEDFEGLCYNGCFYK